MSGLEAIKRAAEGRLREREIEALERIAAALEKLADLAGRMTLDVADTAGEFRLPWKGEAGERLALRVIAERAEWLRSPASRRQGSNSSAMPRRTAIDGIARPMGSDQGRSAAGARERISPRWMPSSRPGAGMGR